MRNEKSSSTSSRGLRPSRIWHRLPIVRGPKRFAFRRLGHAGRHGESRSPQHDVRGLRRLGPGRFAEDRRCHRRSNRSRQAGLQIQSHQPRRGLSGETGRICEDKQASRGLRDSIASQGRDPAWEARMAPGPLARERSLVEKDGEYRFEVLPLRGPQPQRLSAGWATHRCVSAAPHPARECPDPRRCRVEAAGDRQLHPRAESRQLRPRPGLSGSLSGITSRRLECRHGAIGQDSQRGQNRQLRVIPVH